MTPGLLEYRCRRCGATFFLDRPRVDDVAEAVENPPAHLMTARHACSDPDVGLGHHGLADLIGGKEDD